MQSGPCSDELHSSVVHEKSTWTSTTRECELIIQKMKSERLEQSAEMNDLRGQLQSLRVR
jgi:hypothetical protein